MYVFQYLLLVCKYYSHNREKIFASVLRCAGNKCNIVGCYLLVLAARITFQYLCWCRAPAPAQARLECCNPQHRGFGFGPLSLLPAAWTWTIESPDYWFCGCLWLVEPGHVTPHRAGVGCDGARVVIAGSGTHGRETWDGEIVGTVAAPRSQSTRQLTRHSWPGPAPAPAQD